MFILKLNLYKYYNKTVCPYSIAALVVREQTVLDR
jgi:hypothetical protein